MIIASKSIIATATNSVFPIANAACLQIILFHSTNAKLLLFNFARSKMSCIRFYGLGSICIMFYESEAIRTPFHAKNSRFSSRIESHTGSVSPASSLRVRIRHHFSCPTCRLYLRLLARCRVYLVSEIQVG